MQKFPVFPTTDLENCCPLHATQISLFAKRLFFFRCKWMILKLIHVLIFFEPLSDYFPFEDEVVFVSTS